MGYKGHNYLGRAKIHINKQNKGRTYDKLWKKMKRRVVRLPPKSRQSFKQTVYNILEVTNEKKIWYGI